MQKNTFDTVAVHYNNNGKIIDLTFINLDHDKNGRPVTYIACRIPKDTDYTSYFRGVSLPDIPEYRRGNKGEKKIYMQKLADSLNDSYGRYLISDIQWVEETDEVSKPADFDETVQKWRESSKN